MLRKKISAFIIALAFTVGAFFMPKNVQAASVNVNNVSSFYWVWQLQDEVNDCGGIDNLIAKLKSLGITNVCIKYHEGSSFIGGGKNYKADYLSYYNNLKAAGFTVGTWGYNYFNNVNAETNCIYDALEHSDYYIYDPEVDVSNKYTQAQTVCSYVRNAFPDRLLGYSSFPIVDYHEDIPYSVFNKYCNFASPQCYWGEMQWSMQTCIDRTIESYKSNGLDKPIYPSIQTYGVNYNDLIKYTGYKFKSTGLWSLDDADSTDLDFVANRNKDLNLNGNAPVEQSELVKEVQHDLQRVSCLTSGENYATGILDENTKKAIYQFKYIVDLPLNTNVDSNLINGLNQITKKPTIGYGWQQNTIATKYLQWWIGTPKSGVFDTTTIKATKAWQKQNKIWGNPDGVVREKDWNKILR